MALKIVDEGADKLATILFGADAKLTSCSLTLITKLSDATADPTLADADTKSTHATTTNDANATDDITLNPEGGSAPVATISNVGGIVQAAWPEQTFTFTGALDGTNKCICGVQIYSGAILIAEEITTEFVPANNGDTYKVTPVIKFGNGTPA